MVESGKLFTHVFCGKIIELLRGKYANYEFSRCKKMVKTIEDIYSSVEQDESLINTIFSELKQTFTNVKSADEFIQKKQEHYLIVWRRGRKYLFQYMDSIALNQTSTERV